MKRRCALSFFFLLLGGLLVLANTTPAQAIAVTFTDFTPKLLGSVAYPGGPLNFDITNSTGQSWTDFHFAVGDVFNSPVIFGTDAFGTNPYSGPGTATLSTGPDGLKDILDVVGLNIANGGHYLSTVNVFGIEFTLGVVGGNPTTGGPGPGPTPTPEPSTMLLLGSGIIGFVGFRKKFNK